MWGDKKETHACAGWLAWVVSKREALKSLLFPGITHATSFVGATGATTTESRHGIHNHLLEQ